MKKIVGIGEILWDMLPQGKQLGGAPANFAYHVCRLGGNGWAVSAVSDDPLGNEIKSVLAQKNLNTCLFDVAAPTGTVAVTLDKDGVPSYEITENVAWDMVPYTPELETLAGTAQAVCFGTLAQRSQTSRDTILKFIAAMPEDSLKVYDINLRQHYYSEDVIRKSLEVSDILKINDEELETVAELFKLSGSQIEKCRSLIEEFSLKLVILTKGSKGSDVVTTDTVHSVVPDKIEVVDTVGAGDAFTAAFIVAWLRGDSIEAAHRLAGEVSSYVCTRSGAMPD